MVVPRIGDKVGPQKREKFNSFNLPPSFCNHKHDEQKY